MKKSILALYIIFLSSSCATIATYHRTGLVPTVQPPLRDGRPMKNQITLFTGTGFLSSQKPYETVHNVVVNTSDGTETCTFTEGEANYVSKVQPIVGFRWKFGNFDIGVMGEYAPGFLKIKTYKENFNLIPQGDALGAGISMMYSLNFDINFNIGIGADILIYGIPYAKTEIRKDENGVWRNIGDPEYGKEGVFVGSFYLIPNWKFSWGSTFVGINFRNQPTVPKISQERNDPLADIILTILFPPYIFMANNNVLSGNVYTVLSAGISYNLTERAKLISAIYAPVTQSPISYYPSFIVGFEWAL